METKYRVVALDGSGQEIGSWVFEGPRERAIAKSMSDMLDHGIVPAEVHVEPQTDYSHATHGRY